jgi:hypothetical protein
MVPIIGPFLVHLKILDAGFDLDDPDRAVIAKGHEIGAAVGGQRHFGNARKS